MKSLRVVFLKENLKKNIPMASLKSCSPNRLNNCLKVAAPLEYVIPSKIFTAT